MLRHLRQFFYSLRHYMGTLLLSLLQVIVRCAWLLLFCLILAAAGLTWLDSDSGHRWLANQASRTPGLKLTAIDGALLRDPILIGLVYEDADYQIKADRITLNWQVMALLRGELELAKLHAGRLEITVKPTPPDRPPTPAPDRLTLPFGLQVRAFEITELALKNPDITLRNISASLHSDGRQHWLENIKAQHNRASLQGTLQLDGRKPFASAGEFRLTDPNTARPGQIAGEFNGTLRELRISAAGSGYAAHTRAKLLVDIFAPYTYQMLREGEINLLGINPADWSADWPKAKLDIMLALQGTGRDQARGHLTLINHAPGPINALQIPLTGLSSDLALNGQTLHVKSLAALLAGNGTLQGDGQVSTGRVDLKLKLAGIDLSKLWQQQPASQLAGSIQLAGPWLAPDIKADLADQRHTTRLIADLGWINPKTERRLAIHKAELQRGNSHVSARGEFKLQAPHAFRLSGEFAGINPAEFAAMPAGSLSGKLAVNGHLKPEPEMSLDYQLQDSHFNGAPLSGAGSFRLENGTHIRDSAFWLALGRNRVDLHGGFGQERDVLQIQLQMADLHEISPDFTGQASGEFSLSGTPSNPALAGKATLTDIGLPGGFSIQLGQINANVSRDPDAPLHLVVTAADIRKDQRQLDTLQLDIHGSQKQHDIRLRAAGQVASRPASLTAELSGALQADWRWHGVLKQLESAAPVELKLLEPLALQIAPGELFAKNGVFALQQGQIRLDALNWQNGGLETRGELHALPLDQLFKLAGRDDFASDLIFDGLWDLQWHGVLDGHASISRSAGSSIWRTKGPREPMAITDASARLRAHRNWIELDGQVKSSRFGMVEFSGNTTADPASFALAPGASVNLRSHGELPDLSALSSLFGPDLQLAGNARFDLQRSGKLDSPRLSGTASGEGLLIRDPASGLYLRDGTVQITVDNDQLTLNQARFLGGDGEIQATGSMSWRGDDTEATAHVTAKKVTLFSSGDLLLVISGEGEISLKKGVIGVSGQLKADRGEILYRDIDTPKLAEDVVVIGRQQIAPLRPPRLTLQVDVDLGKDFRFRGYGVDAQLTGLLRLRAQSSRPLTANGQVEVQEGIYRAYGQRLDIERGLLSFQGPLDNPGLDILAMRRNQQVEAGVIVVGTALNPRVQLYSEPTVPDTEKLSWMLFGHASENMQGSDAAVMLAAAQALLSNNHGPGLTEELLSKVGIDELGVRSERETDGTPTQIVTISSRLGRHFRINLEKSINGLRDAVSVAYQVGKNWSLVTKFAETEETITANYTHYFE